MCDGVSEGDGDERGGEGEPEIARIMFSPSRAAHGLHGADRGWSDYTTLPLGVGFLGAFTTFSTFSVETQTMLLAGRLAAAGAYIVASVLGGIAGAALGFLAAR